MKKQILAGLFTAVMSHTAFAQNLVCTDQQSADIIYVELFESSSSATVSIDNEQIDALYTEGVHPNGTRLAGIPFYKITDDNDEFKLSMLLTNAGPKSIWGSAQLQYHSGESDLYVLSCEVAE